MPNNPRQQIKHDLDRCMNHLDWAQQIVATTGEKYRESHPEITEQYKTLFDTLELAKGLVDALRSAY